MNQIKIYDIAGAAGVSLATVSRVLNHPEKVKEGTRNRVLKIIRQKGYKPNANARGLASRHSTTVAVVVPSLSRSSVAEMIEGIYDAATEKGYMLRLFIDTKNTNEHDLWGDVIASSVDGILFMNDEMTQDVYKLIRQTPVPVVCVNTHCPYKGIGSVCIDDEAAGYNITKEMIDRGNKSITFVDTAHTYTMNQLKRKGYIKAMQEAGLKEDIVISSGHIEENQGQFEELLCKKCPEVVLAVRDSIAISFMNVAQKKGIKVPEELQVIGFQNTRYAQLSYPKLTCIETPIYQIGNESMEYLTELMQATGEDVDAEAKNIIVDYNVIWRDSTKSNK